MGLLFNLMVIILLPLAPLVGLVYGEGTTRASDAVFMTAFLALPLGALAYWAVLTALSPSVWRLIISALGGAWIGGQVVIVVGNVLAMLNRSGSESIGWFVFFFAIPGFLAGGVSGCLLGLYLMRGKVWGRPPAVR